MEIRIKKPTKTTFNITANAVTTDAIRLQKFLQYISDNLSSAEISKVITKLNFPFADKVALNSLRDFIKK